MSLPHILTNSHCITVTNVKNSKIVNLKRPLHKVHLLSTCHDG